MTLATRCPSCGTVFRVVQDQLRVSEGWVRCGRFSEVFNAADRLLELPGSATPRRATEPGVQAGRALDDLQRIRDGHGSTDNLGAAPDEPGPQGSVGRDVDEDQLEPRAATSAPDDSRETAAPAWHPPSTDAGEAPVDTPEHDARQRSFAVADDATAGTAPVHDDRIEPRLDVSEGIAGVESQTPPPMPEFVRQAERARRWRHPGVRAGLSVLAVLGVLGLVAQALFEYRDIAAARWPGLQPVLERACKAAGCEVGAPRLIEGMVVDSSGLVRTEGTPLYKLSVVLRNRAGMRLAAPAIDLSLTDARGRVVARKVLTVAELGASASALPAGSTLQLQSTVQITEGPVTGYTIELFHP